MLQPSPEKPLEMKIVLEYHTLHLKRALKTLLNVLQEYCLKIIAASKTKTGKSRFLFV